MRIDGPQITGSFNLNGDTVADLDILVTTSSFNMMTASMATTGSNVFVGTQTSSGSIVPSVNNTYDLGSPTHQFRHVYISTGSLYIDGTKVLGSTSSELQITTDTGQSFKILETGADTITLQSNDGNVTLTSTGGGDIVMDPSTGVIGLKGTVSIYTGNKIVSSDGNAIQFGNGIAITGSIVATGTNLISGSSQILNGSGIISSSAQLPSGIISSSTQLPNGIVSSSTQVTEYGFATTGSNNFIGTQTITGSLYISSDLIVQGSSSLQNITASAVNIGANIVNLNTASPAIRFAGMSIFDSGSIGGSGSFLYDSQQDEFIFIHRGEGTDITSSVVLMGPQTYNSVGNEIYPTSNRILKGTGNEHIGDSIMVESGGGIGIGGNLVITGSVVASGTSLWSGSAQLPSGVVSGSAQVLNGTTIHSGSFFNGISVVSGSAQVDVMSTTNIARLATTGSNIFTTGQIISSSVSMPIELWHPDGNGIRFRNASASGKRWDLVSSGDNFVLNETGVSGRLFVSSSGFFGLNTNSPTEMLHVSGSSAAIAIKVESGSSHAAFLEASAYTGSVRTRVQSNTTMGFVGTLTSHPFDVFAGNSFSTRYNTNGNVNVGYQGDQGAKLYVQANLASYAAYFEQVGGATSSYGGVRITTNSTGVNSLYIDNAGTERFSVKGSGVVYVQNALGVGYSDPQYTLQVLNTIGLRANSQNIKAITGTGWGYSPSTYKVVMLGDTTNNVTVSINYDPSGNANSAFSGGGSEVLFRNGASFATPTSANTAFHLNTLVLKDGKVGFGTDSPSGRLDIQGGSDGDGMISMGSNSVSGILNAPANMYINADSDNNSASGVIIFGFNRTGYSGGSTAFQLNENGNATLTGTFTESSSIRYKENVEPIKYGLDKVLQMRGVTYTRKDNGNIEAGVIAEEMNEITPLVVLKNEEGVVDSVSYGRINAYLIEAIKELKKEIEELKQNK